MKISDQIKELARKKGITITELAELLNTSQGNLTNKLVRDNFRISEVTEMLVAMGYYDAEIVARGNNETVIIKNNEVIIKPHSKYMIFDENTSLLEDIEQNGFRDRKFKDLVLELIEPSLQPKFGDLWNTYVPKGFEEGFKAVVANQITFDDFASNLYTYKTPSLNDASNED